MFTTKKIALSLLTMSVLASSQVMAASSATLDVTGTISPVACTPTLGSAGINYGTISTSDLNADTRTQLEMKTVSFAIDCNGASAPFAIRAQDNAVTSTLDVADGTNYGLGKQGTNNIGQYFINFANDVKGDGLAVEGIISTNGADWTAAPVDSDRGPAVNNYNVKLGFADTSSASTVKSLETLTGTLQIRAEIAPTDTLDISNSFGFAGSATLMVEYL